MCNIEFLYEEDYGVNDSLIKKLFDKIDADIKSKLHIFSYDTSGATSGYSTEMKNNADYKRRIKSGLFNTCVKFKTTFKISFFNKAEYLLSNRYILFQNEKI